MLEERFINRSDAGHQLSMELLRFYGLKCVVYGLARGGVIVGFEVSKMLGAPLDVLVVKKLGHPSSPEFALGAITASGEIMIKEVGDSSVPLVWLEGQAKRQIAEAVKSEATYLAGREPVPVKGQIAILVDDGIATGMTMEAAILAIRKLEPSQIVVATPVATPGAVQALQLRADEVVAVRIPPGLGSIGEAYADFTQVHDEEVISCLDTAHQWSGASVR